jgi:hypothetical protein
MDYDDKADAEYRDYGSYHEARIDQLNEIVHGLKARIAQLEALGPLIHVYGDTCKTYGQAIQSCGSSEQQEYRQTRDAALEQIDAILKGGA